MNSEEKQTIKKKDDTEGLTVEMARNPDILLSVRQQRHETGFPLVVVGFAAESEHLLENAQGKLERKGLDLMVANDITASDAGFATDTNRVVLTGSPAHIEQLDDSGNQMLGDAATIDYDNIKGIAVLTGNASVKQHGRGEAHGDKLTYDTATSQMTGESGGTGTVHMVFQPKKKAPAPATSTPAAPAPAASTGKP